jgi:hypothetical protein
MDLKPPKQSDKLPVEVAKSNNSHLAEASGLPASSAGAKAIPAHEYIPSDSPHGGCAICGDGVHGIWWTNHLKSGQ